MPDSRLESTIAVACSALVLVEEGWSERGAIRAGLKQTPEARDRREIFRLVIDTLARKSLIDRAIGSLMGRVPANNEKLSLARVAVVLLLFNEGEEDDRREALDALRKNSPPAFRADLEKLVGDLIADSKLEYYLKGAGGNERVALQFGYPEWWIGYCIHIWGRDATLKLLHQTRIRPRYLHLNPLRSDRESLEELNSLPGLEPVSSLPGFYRVLSEGLSGKVREYVEKGILEGQDLAAYLAVKSGSPTEKDNVMDVCAAPGGKTGALAQLMGNKGLIVAVDYSRGRMRDWKRMVSTLGVKNAIGMAEDATRPALNHEAQFDLVLVDPPCSGSGIFEKNPAMKWHMSPQRLARYHELQYRLLQESSKFLKTEGRIVYSTCSISLEENEDVISRFLTSNPDFETRPILEDWGHPGLRGFGNARRFYPYLDQTSGYFIARLERTS